MTTLSEFTGTSLERIWREHIPITPAGTYALLWGRLPSWRLALDGTVTGINLLAAWLWQPTQGTCADAASLLGENVYHVYARNIPRIPLTDKANRGFFEAKFRVEYHVFGDTATAPLAEARRKFPLLQAYYSALDKSDLSCLWQYMLHISHPETPSTLLTFKTTVSAIVANDGKPDGYVAVYQPLGETRATIDRAHDCCMVQGLPYVHVSEKKRGDNEQDNPTTMNHLERNTSYFELSYPKSKDDYDTTKRLIPSDEDFWSEELGPLLSEEEVQRKLGLRRTSDVFRRVEQRKLLAIPTRKGPAYPAFQFIEDGKIHPTIARVIDIFSKDGAATTPYTIGSWLTSTDEDLEDQTPVEWLQQGKSSRRVITVAMHDVSHLRQ